MSSLAKKQRHKAEIIKALQNKRKPGAVPLFQRKTSQRNKKKKKRQ